MDIIKRNLAEDLMLKPKSLDITSVLLKIAKSKNPITNHGKNFNIVVNKLLSLSLSSD